MPLFSHGFRGVLSSALCVAFSVKRINKAKTMLIRLSELKCSTIRTPIKRMDGLTKQKPGLSVYPN